jgi:hypothetical protein
VGLPLLGYSDAIDNWTPTKTVAGYNPSGYGQTFSGVTYGNGFFLAVGEYYYSDFGEVEICRDGFNWAIANTNGPQYPIYIPNLYDVVFAKGMFVASGWDWYTGSNILSSTDGINWTFHQTGNSNIPRVIYGTNRFVAVGDGLLPESSNQTNQQIFISNDGVTWLARSSGSPINAVEGINDVAYGAGHYVAVSAQSHRYYTSPTGALWTPAYLLPPDGIYPMFSG